MENSETKDINKLFSSCDGSRLNYRCEKKWQEAGGVFKNFTGGSVMMEDPEYSYER